jgi:hypothetical protein
MSNPLLHTSRCVILGEFAARLAPSLAFIEKVPKPFACGLPTGSVTREFSVLTHAGYQSSGHSALPFFNDHDSIIRSFPLSCLPVSDIAISELGRPAIHVANIRTGTNILGVAGTIIEAYSTTGPTKIRAAIGRVQFPLFCESESIGILCSQYLAENLTSSRRSFCPLDPFAKVAGHLIETLTTMLAESKHGEQGRFIAPLDEVAPPCLFHQQFEDGTGDNHI